MEKLLTSNIVAAAIGETREEFSHIESVEEFARVVNRRLDVVQERIETHAI